MGDRGSFQVHFHAADYPKHENALMTYRASLNIKSVMQTGG